MGEKYYGLYNKPKSVLNEWMKEHEDILDRCVFSDTWSWNNGTYISCFRVDVCKDNNLTEFEKNDNKLFFEHFKVESDLGYFTGEFFRELGKVLKEYNLEGDCSLGTYFGCFVYSTYKSRPKMEKIMELIKQNFNLETRLVMNGRQNYNIYIHRDKSFLDALDLPMIPKNTKNEPKEEEDDSISGNYVLLKDIGPFKKGKVFDSYDGALRSLTVQLEDGGEKILSFSDKKCFKKKV